MPPGRKFVEVFENVWKYILGPDDVLQLSDIVCIARNMQLYSAKIENVEIRRFLFSNSRRLKDSKFRNVFSNRDLTYNQRRKLFIKERRSQAA